MHLNPSNFTAGLNFKLQLLCGMVHPPLKLVIPRPLAEYSILVSVLCCVEVPVVCAHSTQWSISPSLPRLWPIWGLSLTYADTVLHPSPPTLGPPSPSTPFASFNVPPSSFCFPHLPSLHHTGSVPLPFSPSRVTGMLTGTVYNKIDNEVLTLL